MEKININLNLTAEEFAALKTALRMYRIHGELPTVEFNTITDVCDKVREASQVSEVIG